MTRGRALSCRSFPSACRQLLRERWLTVAAHASGTTRGATGLSLFQLQRKKKKKYYFCNPFEILSRCFAEVGALAALASVKCCYALGVLYIARVPVGSCGAARWLILNTGPWGVDAKCRRNTFLSSPSWLSFLSIFGSAPSIEHEGVLGGYRRTAWDTQTPWDTQCGTGQLQPLSPVVSPLLCSQVTCHLPSVPCTSFCVVFSV